MDENGKEEEEHYVMQQFANYDVRLQKMGMEFFVGGRILCAFIEDLK